MSRHRYFLEDAYCKELTSTVVEVGESGVKLEKTIFYPRGGGQPADRGQLIVNGTAYPVKKIHSTHDGVFLEIDGTLAVGDEVIQQIDWDYRYQLMQHHTVLHLLSAVVWDRFEAKVTGGTIYPNRARLDFDLDEFSTDLAEELVATVNQLLGEDHQVSISFVDRKVAEEDPELIRTKVNLLPDFITEIRLVRIGDVDLQADGGLHVHSTREIPGVKLLDTENKGKGRKRISVAVT